MKKEVKLSSKRKWVLSGILAFSGVALLTTGFATWIVGTQANNVNNDVTIAVDTVENTSVKLSMTLSDANIALKETTDKTNAGGIIHADTHDVDALKITASEIKLEYGEDYLEEDKHFVIDFSFAYHPGEGETENDSDSNMVSTDTVGARNSIDKTANTTSSQGEKDAWEYIGLPASIDLTTETTGDDDNVITLTDYTIELTWGSYFNGKSPVEFYNEYYETLSQPTDEEVDTLVDNITAELDAMKTALDNKTIVLVATVNQVDNQ